MVCCPMNIVNGFWNRACVTASISLIYLASFLEELEQFE